MLYKQGYNGSELCDHLPDILVVVELGQLHPSDPKSWSHLGPDQGLGEEDEDGKVEDENDGIEEKLINFCTERQEQRICHHQCHIWRLIWEAGLYTYSELRRKGRILENSFLRIIQNFIHISSIRSIRKLKPYTVQYNP